MFAPLTLMITELPRHTTVLLAVIFKNELGSVIVKVFDAEQLLASFTKTVYVPAINPVAELKFPPEGDQV